MRKAIFLTGFMSILLCFQSFSQTAEKEVEAVIKSMFDGMRAKNGEQVAAAFSSDAIMQTIVAKPAGNTVSTNSVADFAKRIGSTSAETQLEERILDYQIKVDGTIQELLPNMTFRVSLENGMQVMAHLCGKMRMRNIRVLVGDGVTVEMSPYDLTKARIVYRHK